MRVPQNGGELLRISLPLYLGRELKELGEGQDGTPELSISLNWLEVNFLLLT